MTMDTFLEKARLNAEQVKEPKTRTIQVGISGEVRPCLTAVGFASEALKDSAVHSPPVAADLVYENYNKSDWMDISKELPEDIARTLLIRAKNEGLAGLIMCRCGNSFTIRLSDPE